MDGTVHGQPGRLTLPFGFAVSILLHSCLAALLLAPIPQPEPPHKTDKLIVELQGLIAERQTEQRKAASPALPAPAPPQETKKKSEPDKPSPRAEIPQKIRPAAKDSPVHVPDIAKAEPLPPPPPVTAPADEDEIQRTIRHQTESDRLKLYLAQLKRRLNDKLIYSQEARKAGIDGIVTIGFSITESGQLLEETLRVVRSSGYPALDRNALSTAIAAAPFDPPPRHISIKIDVRFKIMN